METTNATAAPETTKTLDGTTNATAAPETTKTLGGTTNATNTPSACAKLPISGISAIGSETR